MSKDRRRKRNTTLINVSSAADEDLPPQNEPTSPIVGDTDDRKMPARNEDDATDNSFRRKRTYEVTNPLAQYQQQRFPPDPRVRRNQALLKTIRKCNPIPMGIQIQIMQFPVVVVFGGQ